MVFSIATVDPSAVRWQRHYISSITTSHFAINIFANLFPDYTILLQAVNLNMTQILTILAIQWCLRQLLLFCHLSDIDTEYSNWSLIPSPMMCWPICFQPKTIVMLSVVICTDYPNQSSLGFPYMILPKCTMFLPYHTHDTLSHNPHSHSP